MLGAYSPRVRACVFFLCSSFLSCRPPELLGFTRVPFFYPLGGRVSFMVCASHVLILGDSSFRKTRFFSQTIVSALPGFRFATTSSISCRGMSRTSRRALTTSRISPRKRPTRSRYAYLEWRDAYGDREPSQADLRTIHILNQTVGATRLLCFASRAYVLASYCLAEYMPYFLFLVLLCCCAVPPLVISLPPYTTDLLLVLCRVLLPLPFYPSASSTSDPTRPAHPPRLPFPPLTLLFLL